MNWDELPLGERSDAVIGRMVGLCADRVRWARRRRGIALSEKAREEANALRREGARKGFAAMGR